MRRFFPGHLCLLLAMLIIITGFGCSKEDDPPSKTALLTAGPWKMTAQKYHGDYDGDGTLDPVDYDLYAEYEPCEKDDFVKFNTDGTGTIDAGLSKCDPDDPQSDPIEWLLKENETVIKIIQGILALDIKILELSNTTLKIEYGDPLGSSTDKIIETYSH